MQSIVERQIQVSGCRYVDEVLIYDSEQDVLDILSTKEWDIRIIGDEYKDKDYVTAYRKYYQGAKAYFAKWERGVSAPDWWVHV